MNLAISSKAEGRNPKDVICFLCGRVYGTASITIHEKNCESEWERKQAALPREQRRPKPRRPDLESRDLLVNSQVGQATQNYNDAAFNTYLEQAREECGNCGRKFAEGRLTVHQRSCKTDNRGKEKVVPVKSPVNNTTSSPKESGKPKEVEDVRETCPNCARNFNPGRLEVHLRSCKILGTKSVKQIQPAKNDIPVSNNHTPSNFCTGCRHKFKTAENFCPSCGNKK